jgi:AcrR family transcriptional regulator
MASAMRAQQKEETRQRIAHQAGRLFGEHGFDQTSVRDIATAAGVDPALVLHYFGSKRALFRQVMGDLPAVDEIEIGDPAEFVLDGLVAKLDDHASASLTQLRSMLTNADAKDHAKTQLERLAAALARELPGEQCEARAHLLLATNLGIAIARELVGVDCLTSLSAADLEDLLRPAVVALIQT